MTEQTERRLIVLDRLLLATKMSDGSPYPDTTRVNVSAGDLRTLLSAVDEARSQLAELLNLMKDQASE